MKQFRTQGDGRWYPAERRALRTMVRRYLETGAEKVDAGIMSLPLLGGIVPHAGYPYSGAVAGTTFAALRASAKQHTMPDLIVILGFSHQEPFGGLCLLDADEIQTPLGELAVDRESYQWLLHHNESVFSDNHLHMGEHSAENQLPFVQEAFPDVPVIVGLCGGHTPQEVHPLGDALRLLGRHQHVLVVASTDLLHDPDYATVAQCDQKTLHMLEKLDYEGLRAAWSPPRQVCCGIAPVSVLLTYAAKLGCRTGHILEYQNSGDVDPSCRGMLVVGYGAVVYGSEPET